MLMYHVILQFSYSMTLALVDSTRSIIWTPILHAGKVQSHYGVGIANAKFRKRMQNSEKKTIYRYNFRVLKPELSSTVRYKLMTSVFTAFL